MSKVIIRQHKSAIGQKDAARQTLESLGLRRPGNVVEREDSATLRGQLRRIAHLVEVAEDRRVVAAPDRTPATEVVIDRRKARG